VTDVCDTLLLGTLCNLLLHEKPIHNRIYRTGPLKPRNSKKHYYFTSTSTSKPILHLRKVHYITNITDRSISIDKAWSLIGSTQLSISSFPSDTPKEFDFEVFKGLLLELFTTE
jgi:hypothetical protein